MLNEEPDVYEDGFRLNVCIVLCNDANQVLIAQRFEGRNWWQFPQGGIHRGETPTEAMYRELYEEIGLRPHQVSVIAQTPRWFRYRLPRDRIPREIPGIGQKQKWFLLRLRSPDHVIDLARSDEEPEFARWTWVDFWEPLRRTVRFKHRVYREALEHLSMHCEHEAI